MKSTLKKVGIFAAIVFIGAVGALAGYVLITKNKTYYIYDLRIVQPIDEATSYVYTDNERKYTSVKNQKVYMTSEEENFIPIAVYLHSSTNTRTVEITSSNTNVAKIVYQDNKCFINYLKAGKATITSSHGGVSDSFSIEVFDQVAEDFSVYDYKYYGDYASYFPNNIIGYSDGLEYAYDYKAFSASGENAGDLLNNDLLRIDTTTLNTNIFEKVKIDGANKTLVIKCKSDIEDNIDEQIVVQSYTYSEEGTIKVENNYVVNVHIVTYIPEFLQIEVSKTPNFDEGVIFMNTHVIDDSTLTEENIMNNPDILDEYLSYKKAENNLVALGESEVYGVFFTKKVSKIYLRFRKVYTNGDIVYLNPKETASHFDYDANSNYLTLAPTENYFILRLEPEYFDSNTEFEITIDLLVDGSEFAYDLSHVFKFKFAELTQDNIDLFYDYDEITGVYTYKYWDLRTRFDNEIYNTEGNVIGFRF